jgi:PilZ domain
MSTFATNRIERRRHVREVIGGDYVLRVDTGGKREPTKCFIWDISEGGARLTLTEHTRMPAEMAVLIGNVKRSVRLVWHKEDQIGIEFLETEEWACADDFV